MENYTNNTTETKTKFCRHCGGQMPATDNICTTCGKKQDETPMYQQPPQYQQPQIIINNANTNTNTNINGGMNTGKPKNKWISFALCVFLGYFGAHKFYEGKIGTGILYLCTFGLFFVGVFIDFITILNKPNPYYV